MTDTTRPPGPDWPCNPPGTVGDVPCSRGRRCSLHRPGGRCEEDRMDLATDYLGLRLRNPLVASASPLSQTVDGIRRLADAGIGAVVLYSQFEEELHDPGTLPLRYAPEGADGAGSAADQ